MQENFKILFEIKGNITQGNQQNHKGSRTIFIQSLQKIVFNQQKHGTYLKENRIIENMVPENIKERLLDLIRE